MATNNDKKYYSKKIELFGLGQKDLAGNVEYKSEIGIDNINKKILFSGNNVKFHLYYDGHKLDSKATLYKKITIKDGQSKVIKEIIINGMDSMEDIIKKYNLQDGIQFKDNYTIDVWLAEPQRTKVYEAKMVAKQENQLTYRIKENQLDCGDCLTELTAVKKII